MNQRELESETAYFCCFSERFNGSIPRHCPQIMATSQPLASMLAAVRGREADPGPRGAEPPVLSDEVSRLPSL